MKRFLLSATAAIFAFSGFAQSVPQAKVSPALQNKTIAIPARLVTNQNPVAAEDIEAQAAPRRLSATETEIGNTRYDLQSNSAIQRRIINHGNGALSAAWTFSSSNSWTTRGTGYNYFNGSSWGTAPTSELETERTGWPSLMATSGGREVIISHSTANSILRQVDRNSIGSGTWSQANLTSLAAQVWNRAAASGNTVHCVGMTLPTANGGTAYNGMDGAFLYNRSTNGGVSYDITNYTIPGTGSTYFDGFDGDSYDIDAKGDTVAIVVGGLGRGVQLFKSTNNGQTWSKTDVLLSDIWFVESETFIDTSLDARLLTSDGNVSVLLDHDGMAHVWYGRMYIANPDITDGLINYYPGTNAIDYWNEGFPISEGIFLTGALDINGNGTLEMTDWGQYRFAGLASQPQAGIDDAGCIYLTYTAVREDLTNGAQNYRHTYVMMSCDNGCSWSFPIDVTGASSNDFSECVYPTIARRVDTAIHVLYMSDNEPGIAVQGDEDPVGVNKMIYLNEDVDRFDTTEICPTAIVGDSMLCLGGDLDLVAMGCGTSYLWTGPGAFVATTQEVTVTAVGTYSCTINTPCGTQTEEFNVVEYTGTAGPFVNVTATNNYMCAGDTSVITAHTNIGGLTYQWSANAGNATTQSVTVTAPGTYDVTVTACGGGTTVESYTITEPTTAPDAVIIGDLSICPGETTELTVLPVSGGSYAWSTGSTAQTISVNAAGTYTVNVTNCGGTSTDSVVVETEALPVAAITASETEVCEGGQLTATATGGTGYTWSNGNTTAALTISQPSESGTYTVTVTNDCGDEDTEEVTLTIFENPAAPTITFDGTNYVSSQTGAGTHIWYVDGQLIPTAIGNTLANNSTYFGAQITCVYIDENGCESPESSAILNTDEVASANAINVFPNPSNGRFDIRFGEVSGKVEIEVTDVLGKVVYRNNVAATTGMVETVDLTGYESGVYQLSLKGEGVHTTQSVIIE